MGIVKDLFGGGQPPVQAAPTAPTPPQENAVDASVIQSRTRERQRAAVAQRFLQRGNSGGAGSTLGGTKQTTGNQLLGQ